MKVLKWYLWLNWAFTDYWNKGFLINVLILYVALDLSANAESLKAILFEHFLICLILVVNWSLTITKSTFCYGNQFAENEGKKLGNTSKWHIFRNWKEFILTQESVISYKEDCDGDLTSEWFIFHSLFTKDKFFCFQNERNCQVQPVLMLNFNEIEFILNMQ